MNVPITIFTAVASHSMESFKEISYKDFSNIEKQLQMLANAYSQPRPLLNNGAGACLEKREEIKKKALKLRPKYEEAKKKHDEFYQRHHETFIKGEVIRESGSNSFYWCVVLGLSNIEQFLRYRQNHADVYDKLEELHKEMNKYYINIETTTERELHLIEKKTEEENSKRLKEWQANVNNKVNEANKIFQADTLRDYTYLIKDLEITINGPVCDIKCMRRLMGLNWDSLQQPYAFEKFNTTLINQKINIQRLTR